ncbi:hypothetical protein GCM10009859_20890 [Kocuria salsicia]
MHEVLEQPGPAALGQPPQAQVCQPGQQLSGQFLAVPVAHALVTHLGLEMIRDAPQPFALLRAEQVLQVEEVSAGKVGGGALG